MPARTLPGLNFIVVGASVAGLTCAIGLKKSGHSVTVLEREPCLSGAESIPSGAAGVPPNGCKVLFDWGLEKDVMENAVAGHGFMMYSYDPSSKGKGERDAMGVNLWDPELMESARGEFLQMKHRVLLRLLHDLAIKPPAPSEGTVTIEFDAEVTSIESDDTGCNVILASGAVFAGHAVIGADGSTGFVRKYILEEEIEDSGAECVDADTDLCAYSMFVPRAIAEQDEELKELYDSPRSNMVSVYFGNQRAAKVFLNGQERDAYLWLYTTDGQQEGSWTRPGVKPEIEAVEPADPVIKRIYEKAATPLRFPMKQHHVLDSWVSQSGRIIAIGEAAHPFPPFSLHTISIAIEDGAFMGKIFSHTRNPERIPEFLYAFEENRKPRCEHILQAEQMQLQYFTLPDGDQQQERDDKFLANKAAGRNAMSSPDENMQEIVDDLRVIFGYEPTDEADEWWMSWGRFQEDSSQQQNTMGRMDMSQAFKEQWGAATTVRTE
ncbi:unnamed protein product [Mycena citricolor]|uniref:FAD-binding domain-containing protein n=1 Tax=Mycena citricolor TaxID=2018698 RepID=A0AAD2Q488_9AGAR|nr:unnamed protein product [Mycena citricolor]CAK5274526.1 unnamed protein product [Mycena citricolor]